MVLNELRRGKSRALSLYNLISLEIRFRFRQESIIFVRKWSCQKILSLISPARVRLIIDWISCHVLLGVVSTAALSSSTRKDSPEMPENLGPGGLPRSLSDSFSAEDNNKTGTNHGSLLLPRMGIDFTFPNEMSVVARERR
jgi:hypothetical protein